MFYYQDFNFQFARRNKVLWQLKLFMDFLILTALLKELTSGNRFPVGIDRCRLIWHVVGHVRLCDQIIHSQYSQSSSVFLSCSFNTHNVSNERKSNSFKTTDLTTYCNLCFVWLFGYQQMTSQQQSKSVLLMVLIY